jgi:EamA domain-containing membrane protein RarD
MNDRMLPTLAQFVELYKLYGFVAIFCAAAAVTVAAVIKYPLLIIAVATGFMASELHRRFVPIWDIIDKVKEMWRFVVTAICHIGHRDGVR